MSKHFHGMLKAILRRLEWFCLRPTNLLLPIGMMIDEGGSRRVCCPRDFL
jgi:hypothetical protein